MTGDAAATLFADSCAALGAEVYGRTQIADKQLARKGFERLTMQYPGQCDGWLGLAASGRAGRDVLENAYRVLDTAGELLAAADVAVNAVDFTFNTGLYVQLPARGTDGLTLAVAAARMSDNEFAAAHELLDRRQLDSQPLFAGWMLAVVYFKAKRWHDVRRVLAPLIGRVDPNDTFLYQAMVVTHGLADAYLGMWDKAFERLRAMGAGPIPNASADALVTSALCARQLDRPEEATALLNEAYAVAGIEESTQATIAAALSDPTYGIKATTAARIDARTDYWDAATEPGEHEFVRQIGAARRAELNAEADALLDEFVGMDEVKDQIDRLESSVIMDSRRAARGMQVRNRSKHLLLKGAPGTGKSQVARVIGLKYYAAEIIPANNFVEVTRGDLVDKVIGGSESKIRAKLSQVIDNGGGVLFLDEAYLLTNSKSENDFGPLVIGELLTAMVNHPDKLIVIAAGYIDKMDEFLDSNDGFRSRFTRQITIPSYTPEQLVEITVRIAARGSSIVEDRQPLLEVYTRLWTATALDTTGTRRPALDVLGNGRLAENLMTFAEEERDYRLRSEGVGEDAPDAQLQTITISDLRTALAREMKRKEEQDHIELSSDAMDVVR